MGGQRAPHPTGTAGTATSGIDDGTLARATSPRPGTLGAAAGSEGGPGGWLRTLRTATLWPEMQPAILRLLQGPGFGAGVAVGIGEAAVASAVARADLVRVFALADVHDVLDGTLRTLQALRPDPLPAALGAFDWSRPTR